MKNLKLLLAVLFTLCFMACHHHRHVTIATQSGNYNVKLEYEGTIVFNDDQTQIEEISRDGYISFKQNDDELYAERDPSGKVAYQLNGEKVNKLDATGQEMLNEAIKMVVKSSHR